MAENIFYVYVHRKSTNGDIFYVGKGKLSRHKSKSGRSAHWRNIVNKHGFVSEIIRNGMSEQDAYEYELNYISMMKNEGYKLCNIAEGGIGGLSGVKLKEEHKEKLREAKIGKKQLHEHAEKSRNARKGQKNTKDHIEKYISFKRKKVINSHGEIFSSTSEAAREMSRRNGVYASQGNISSCARGERENAYGYTWSYDLSKIPEFKETQHSWKQISCSNGMKFKSVQEAKLWVISWRGAACHQPISYAARDNKSAYGFSWDYI